MKIKLRNTKFYQVNEPVVDLEKWLIKGNVGGELVIFLSSPEKTLGKEQATLLSKLTGAIGYSPDVVPVYQVPVPEEVPFHLVTKVLSPKYVIAFGFSPARLHLNATIERNGYISLGGTRLLLAHSLEDLTGAAREKEALWKGLQQMFNLV